MQEQERAVSDGDMVSEAQAAGAPASEGQADGDAAAVTAPEQLTQLQEELAQEQARYAELMDRYQRAGADFQNSRRRLEKQMADGIERASHHIMRRLLPVLDDMDLAFRNVPAGASEEQQAWTDGFRAIQKKLMAALEEEGLKAMPEEGPFDPTRHEAVTSEPSDSVESGHIIATLRRGYEADGAVLRPAMVRVAQ